MITNPVPASTHFRGAVTNRVERVTLLDNGYFIFTVTLPLILANHTQVYRRFPT